MQSLSGKKIAILATNGFEQVELTVPHLQLKDAGATVDVISPERERIRGWNHTDWGDYVGVDRLVDEVSADQYDALVLPGGQINPDVLRLNDKALDLIKAFRQQKKVVAAICHAPWLLVETGIIKDRRVTSYPSIKTDVINEVGRQPRRCRQRAGDQPQAGRPRCVLRKDRRGNQRGPSRTAGSVRRAIAAAEPGCYQPGHVNPTHPYHRRGPCGLRSRLAGGRGRG